MIKRPDQCFLVILFFLINVPVLRSVWKRSEFRSDIISKIQMTSDLKKKKTMYPSAAKGVNKTKYSDKTKCKKLKFVQI